MYVYVCLYRCRGTCMWCPWRLEEGIRSPGVESQVVLSHPSRVLGIELWSCARSASILTTKPSLQPFKITATQFPLLIKLSKDVFYLNGSDKLNEGEIGFCLQKICQVSFPVFYKAQLCNSGTRTGSRLCSVSRCW